MEDSVPKAASIHKLELRRCETIFLKDSPSSLKRASIQGTHLIESCLEQIMLNNAFLEELKIHYFHGPNLKGPMLDSLGTLSLASLSANLRSQHF